MRYALIMLLLCFSLTLSATTYYVATNGSNSNNGTSTSGTAPDMGAFETGTGTAVQVPVFSSDVAAGTYYRY